MEPTTEQRSPGSAGDAQTPPQTERNQIGPSISPEAGKGGFDFKPHDRDTWLIRSMSSHSAHHIVDIAEGTCSCQDFEFKSKGHEAYRCKHLHFIYGVLIRDGRRGFDTSTTDQIKAVRDAANRLSHSLKPAEHLALMEVVLRLQMADEGEAEATGLPL